MRSLLRSNLYIQFGDHEQQTIFQSLYNLNLKETNSISCSTGNRTYFYFPVQITSKNITGSVRINFDARIANDYAFSTVMLTIHNGETIIIVNCCFMHMYMQAVVEIYCTIIAAKRVLKAVLCVKLQ